jgi:hypothetical protein
MEQAAEAEEAAQVAPDTVLGAADMLAAIHKGLGSSGGRRSPSSGPRWVIAEVLAGHSHGMIVLERSESGSMAEIVAAVAEAAAAAADSGPDAAVVAAVAAVERGLLV